MTSLVRRTDTTVPAAQPAPLTAAEQLTLQFYDWERRGRGWQLWPYPVELEPPYRPFLHFLPPLGPVYDDARKHTLLSSLVEKLRGAFVPPTTAERPVVPFEIPEPEPERFVPDSPLAEVQVSVPPALKVTREAAEQFLLALTYSASPLAFEVVGLQDGVIVQVACREEDLPQFREQLRAHFPEAVLTEEASFLRSHWSGAGKREAVLVDFGLSREFMLPLRAFRAFDVDPLIGVAGALSDLRDGEVGVLQILFQAVRYPWTESILRAVTDWEGRSFFADAPEILPLAKDKVSRPPFAALIRVAARSPLPGRAWQIAKALGGSLRPFSSPASNELIPLANDGYDVDEHEEDLLARTTHRSGMILNSEELVSLVHLPSASVRVEKLKRETKKTKAVPVLATGHELVLGENVHAGKSVPVTLSTDQRIRHTYVIGASGTGKSTLLLNMILQGIQRGEGVGVLDPHGDLIDEILGCIPEDRFGDVVLLDPSDADWPVGFNILQAHSELERNLVASDLVAGFRRLATSWGDQMTSVLGNAVLAFLESDERGTLADLRRFLIEPDFRRRFLGTVRDTEVVYYWQKEFPLLAGKPQAPLLTRLDTFLRPKLIRHMVSQKENRLDFASIMNEGRIFLAKLAQGAIGEENAYLLGTLIVSKFHQLALSRQELEQVERRAFYLYIDEFHNFVTPSMGAILAGARKYKLGLTLAHQDLRQLGGQDAELLSAVLSNPCTRICFRVGDLDARKLQDGFSFFDAKDLQNLGVGEAICRVDQAQHDFNLRTFPLPVVDPAVARERRERVVALSREKHATPRAEVEAALRAAAPAPEPAPRVEERKVGVLRHPVTAPAQAAPPPSAAKPTREPSREPIPTLPAPPTPGRGGRQHKYLQELIKRWAESRGWRATIEKQILDGLGSVDVALEKDGRAIACEISVTSTPEQELGNVQKCLAAGFEHVAVVFLERKALVRTRETVAEAIGKEASARVHLVTPEEFFEFMENLEARAACREETIRGRRIKVEYQATKPEEQKAKKRAIAKVVLDALKRIRGGD